MLLEETPAVLSLGKLCQDPYWISCQKPHLTKKRARELIGNKINLCAIHSPWFIYEILYAAHTYIFFITGFRI